MMLYADFEANPRIYSLTFPLGEILGVVNRDGQRGALVRSTAGILVQVNAGVVRSLPQRAAKEAVGNEESRLRLSGKFPPRVAQEATA
jgi:hypothetical protein